MLHIEIPQVPRLNGGTFAESFTISPLNEFYTPIATNTTVEIRSALVNPGWKVVVGNKDSGKSEILKEICRDLLARGVSGIGPPLDVIWIDMHSSFSEYEALSIIASQLSLRGSSSNDLYVSFRRLLESLMPNSIIVLDHMDGIACSKIIKIINLFSDSLCLVLSAQNKSVLSFIEITVPILINVPPLSHYDAVKLAAHLLNQHNLDEGEAENIIKYAGNATPGAIQQLCGIRALSNGPFPSSSTDNHINIIELMLNKVLTDNDRRVMGCLSPLLQMNGTPFPKALGWYLCKDYFGRGTSTPSSSPSWCESWTRLLKIHWLRETDEDVVYINATSLPASVVIESDQWGKYYEYWGKEWSYIAGTAAKSEVLSSSPVRHPPSTTASPSPSPIHALNLGRWAVAGGGARTALDSFDRWRQHYEVLMSSWVAYDTRPAADKGMLTTCLAGNVGMICVSRLTTSRGLALAKAIVENCNILYTYESNPRMHTTARLEMGLQLLYTGHITDAMSFFRGIVTAIQTHNENITMIEVEVEGEMSEAMIKIEPELLACGLSCLGRSISVTEDSFEEIDMILSEALQRWRQCLLGGSMVHPELFDALMEYGKFLGARRQFRRAEELLVEAQGISTTLYGKNHLATAEARRELARVKQLEGCHVEAEPLFEGAIDIFSQVYGDGNLLEADILRELAMSLSHMGKHLPALTDLTDAMSIYTDIKGENDPTVADIMVELGAAVEVTGSFNRAIEFYSEALLILESQLGDSDAHVAGPLHSLASVLFKCGRYDDAKPMLERALVIYQGTKGEDDVQAGEVALTLAKLLHATNHFSEATDLYRRALGILREGGEPRHEQAGDILVQLGRLHFDNDNHVEAEVALDEALVIYRRLLGDVHFKVLDTFRLLGEVFLDAERPAEAEENFQRTLNGYRMVCDPSKPHPAVANAYHDVASAQHANRSYEKARKNYSISLDLSKQLYGECSAEVAKILHNLATLEDDCDLHEEALKLFEQCLEVLREIHGPVHPQIAVTMHNLAGMFESEGSFTEAKNMYNDALVMYSEIFGDEHPSIQEIRGQLYIISEKERGSKCSIT